MTMTSQQIETLIKEFLPDADVHIIDTKGDGYHFKVDISSSLFKGKTTIEQHQMVYKSLTPHIGEELHAISINTKEK